MHRPEQQVPFHTQAARPRATQLTSSFDLLLNAGPKESPGGTSSGASDMAPEAGGQSKGAAGDGALRAETVGTGGWDSEQLRAP